MQRRFYNHFEGSLFYTYSHVMDVQSLSSSTAAIRSTVRSRLGR